MTDTVDVDAGADDFLGIFTRRYDALLGTMTEVRRSGSAELLLDWSQMTANFAAMHHPGRFADGALENPALEIGRDLEARSGLDRVIARCSRAAPRGRPSKRRVLHVATTISSIGGHTRTILNWIRSDADSEHSLVTTSSLGVNVPPALAASIEASGGRIVTLSYTSPLTDRALWLREWARRNADIVVLHIVPHDVVPVAAFARDGGPPVALINLADQCFWVGCTIADSVVHLRDIGASTSRDVRFTRNDLLLPIPLHETVAELGKAEARRSLGIPDSQLMVLSVGRSIKYAPTARHNFFRAACKILERNAEVHLYVVGVSEHQYSDRPDYRSHERMHLLGSLTDATLHQRAADVYIEGFPFGSQTALLESVMPGTPCVAAIEPATPLLATQDVALNGLVENPIDEEAYVSRVSELVGDRTARDELGSKLRARVLRFHVGDSWRGLLETVYDAVGKLEHRPRFIPAAQGRRRSMDLAISRYHGTRLVGTDRERLVADEVAETIKMSAYFMRERGFHLDSFRLLCLANRGARWDRESVLYLLKLLPHKVYSSFRRLVRSR